MKVTIEWMAVLKERMGAKRTVIEISDGARLSDLLDILQNERPDLEPYWRTVRFATEKNYLSPKDILPNEEVIFAIPPVSGGL